MSVKCEKLIKQVLVILIVCLLTCAVCPTTTNAHRPGSVTLDYNIDTKVLSVTITHSVSNSAKHYVDII